MYYFRTKYVMSKTKRISFIMNPTLNTLNDFEDYVESEILELKSLGYNESFLIETILATPESWFLFGEGNEVINIGSFKEKKATALQSLFSTKKRNGLLFWCYLEMGEEIGNFKSGEYNLMGDSIEFFLNPEIPYLTADIMFYSSNIIVLRRTSPKRKSQETPTHLFHIEAETESLLFMVNRYANQILLFNRNDNLTSVKARRILVHKILSDLKSCSIRIHRSFNWDMTYVDVIIDEGRPIEKPFPLGLSFLESKTLKALNGYYDIDDFRYYVANGIILRRFRIKKLLSNRNKVLVVFCQEEEFFKVGDFIEINRKIPKDDLYVADKTQFTTEKGKVVNIKLL